jgi:hypothetical protein
MRSLFFQLFQHAPSSIDHRFRKSRDSSDIDPEAFVSRTLFQFVEEAKRITLRAFHRHVGIRQGRKLAVEFRELMIMRSE